MGTVTLSNPQNGQTTDATVIANNNDALEACINGGLDNANVASGANLAVAKLAPGTDGYFLQVVSGVPTWVAPTLVGAKVYRTSNQTLTGASTTVINWDNEEFDTSTFHDNSTNNTRLTVPTTAKYFVNVILDVTGTQGAQVDTIDIRKNGSTVVAKTSFYDDTSVASGLAHTLPVLLALTAADYIEVRYTRPGVAGTLVGTQAGCSVSIHLVAL
jgi:hypothetical protein